MSTLHVKPQPKDKYAQARADKNSPERQEKARKYKDTPPKSVQAELDRVAASKKKTPRGPKASRPRGPAPSFKEHLAQKRVRDDVRVHALVYSILSAWKMEIDRNDNEASHNGIIKVNRRKIEGALRDLKNTRFTKIPTLINDILTGTDICDEFGMWVYVEHDSPDWIFLRLPKDSTPVLRAEISVDNSGDSPVTTVATSSEVLLEDVGDEPLEMLDCDERDIEDLETKAMRIELINKGIIKPEDAEKLHRPDLMKLLADHS